MWVFDGEEWTREGGTEETQSSVRRKNPGPEEMLPELQILEITPTPRTREIHVPVVTPQSIRKPR